MHHDEQGRDMRAAILDGLCRPLGCKEIPTTYIYELPGCDLTPEEERYFSVNVGYEMEGDVMPSGAALFSRIVSDPDYYVDRAELDLLATHMTAFPAGAVVTELGPGDGRKTGTIFAAQSARDTLRYQAIDVSGDFLNAAAAEVVRAAPGMQTPPVTCRGDFMAAMHGFAPADIVLFLGTTISNFEPEAAALLLARIGVDYLKPGGLLVIGQDGNQDTESLSHCYEDRRHHTAAFVMNGLRQIRRDILKDIDLSQFRYRAQFDRESRMMRMGIESMADRAYDIDGETVDFAAGEFIQVGQSRKYTGEEVREMAGKAGYAVVKSAASAEGVNLHFFRNG